MNPKSAGRSSEAAFHELRSRTLQDALASLEPRRVGRPPRVRSEQLDQVETLQDQLTNARLELHAGRIREEIALSMPYLLKDREKTPSQAVKKTKLQRRRGPSRRRPIDKRNGK